MQPPTFVGCQFVDPFDVVTYGEQTLPSGYGVAADYRVDSAEGSADIVWGPAGLLI